MGLYVYGLTREFQQECGVSWDENGESHRPSDYPSTVIVKLGQAGALKNASHFGDFGDDIIVKSGLTLEELQERLKRVPQIESVKGIKLDFYDDNGVFLR